MTEPDFAKLTITRTPESAPADSTMVDAREATRKAREALTGHVAESKALDQTPSEEPAAAPHEPDEDLESVTVKLPNGLTVEFGPPRDVSLTMRIIKLLGDAADGLQGGIYRILLSVRSIDGKNVAPITNTIDAERLANRIGDTGIDILLMVSQTHWKPLRLTQLPVIKKNQRKQ